jgi:hypothetical protein
MFQRTLLSTAEPLIERDSNQSEYLWTPVPPITLASRARGCAGRFLSTHVRFDLRSDRLANRGQPIRMCLVSPMDNV